VGLVAMEERRLEVTNCFPVSKHAVGDEEEDSVAQHQHLMIRKFQQVNIDYLSVGFYQSSPFGACFTEAFVESVFDYQSTVDDSVVLVYDPIKTSQGMLTIKAYRLSEKAMKLCYKDFSSQSIKRSGLSYENLFEELPVSIKNSHLVNVALCELGLMKKSGVSKPPFLDLGAGGNLEQSVRQLMGHIDSLNQEVIRYNRYFNLKQKQDALRENQLQKRQQENENRKARGEHPLQEDDINKMFKPIQAPSMLDGLLAAAEVNSHVDHILTTATQNLGKLFMAEAVLEGKRGGTERTSSMHQSL
jgi:translation initiation factor 3 subunit H